MVFLSRRVRPTPSRWEADARRSPVGICPFGRRKGPTLDPISMVATGRRFGLLIVPGSQAIDLYVFAARIPTRRSTDMQTSAGREQASGLVTGRVDCARRRVFVGRQLKLFDSNFTGEPDEAYNSTSSTFVHTRTWLRQSSRPEDLIKWKN